MKLSYCNKMNVIYKGNKVYDIMTNEYLGDFVKYTLKGNKSIVTFTKNGILNSKEKDLVSIK